MTTVGMGKYTYKLIQDWAKLPEGESFGVVSSLATDSEDRVYVFQRKDPPIVIFDPDGNYLGAWGHGAITLPHGFSIVDDIVYLTDREDSVASSNPGRQAASDIGPARGSLRHRLREPRQPGAPGCRPL